MITVTIFALLGLAAGWFVSQVRNSGGSTRAKNLVVGLIGGLVLGYFFKIIGLIGFTLFKVLVVVLIITFVVVWIVGYIKRSS